MRRKYLVKVEVWQNTATTDGFGGNTNTPTLLGSSWSNIATIPTDKLLNYGLDITQQAVTIKTRWRDDIDYFANAIYFVYNGVKFYPTRIFNKDLVNEEITIIASSS